ncbi:hypothetical protein M8J76_015652 [Diaphorina citri]|nr:hypothetical protein M8J76_004720 [Diaphorina citri]KAI5741641.1 hypothetical protein M8J76_015652 [Diaphorina citri]
MPLEIFPNPFTEGFVSPVRSGSNLRKGLLAAIKKTNILNVHRGSFVNICFRFEHARLVFRSLWKWKGWKWKRAACPSGFSGSDVGCSGMGGSGMGFYEMGSWGGGGILEKVFRKQKCSVW